LRGWLADLVTGRWLVGWISGGFCFWNIEMEERRLQTLSQPFDNNSRCFRFTYRPEGEGGLYICQRQ
jgi:hypothetical protein